MLMTGSMSLLAQKSHKSDGVIISCGKKEIVTLADRWKSKRSYQLEVEFLGDASECYLLKSENDSLLYHWCKAQPEILTCEYNSKLDLRVNAMDPDIDSQYYLNTIRAFEAWKFASGGKQINKENITVVVIDNGFDLSHEDLNNVWFFNSGEIKDDGIDNDGSGLIDDTMGWNIDANNPKHYLRAHGTNVTGVIAATHNNNKGIAGVHPNVKIYPITTENTVSQTIKAYELVIKQKQLYLESEGKKGLNVSVLNHSSGLDFAFAKDYPIWCSMYDKMGQLGILSVVSTTNESYNVDSLGDMPSTCISPYTIVVGATSKKDEYFPSGYGTTNVDISAPGEKIYTTHPMFIKPYFYSLGTSVAAPMVAGAVSFLYSIPCDSFYLMLKNNPAAASLALKDIIMASTDRKSTLSSRSVSRGRLNMLKAVQEFQNRFNCTCPLSINKIKFFRDQLIIDFFTGSTDKLSVHVYESTGKVIYSQLINVTTAGPNAITLDDFRHKGDGIRFLQLSDEKCSITKGFSILGN